jgi:FAD dependent oxidoreductase TIGR03364
VSERPRAVVVGAGILGTWHALELCRTGFAVEHLEAEAAPTGASVRNFGLLWVSGRRSGEELEVARRARRRWEEVAADAPDIGFRAAGSITVATTDVERKVMEEFAHRPDAAERGITFLEPEGLATANPAVRGATTGGLSCPHDALVEPRLALGALRAHLEAAPAADYRYHPGRRIVDVDARAAIDHTGTRWDADIVILATGVAFDHLRATEHTRASLRRVRLQMLETEPHPDRLTTALADADSMRYYPAYEVAPLDLLGEQNDVAAAHHLQLLVAQRADGGLTIGDTHAYGEPFDFALADAPTLELLARAERILGTALPPVRRRWEGVYSQCVDGAVCLREEVAPNVWLVTGPGGRGMTCAPAIAADTLRAAGITTDAPPPPT